MSFGSKINGLREIWKFDNRLYLAFSRLVFPHETVQLYRLGKVEFISDHSAGDANGAREVLTSPMYRELLEQIALPAEISVIDLGSNNGGFPLLLRSLGHDVRKLACVELNPETYGRLEFNLRRNFRSGFVALNAAVAGREGELNVSLGRGGAGDSIYGRQTDDGAAEFAIRAITFDALFDEVFCGETVDICKIDIEGAEFEMFAAAERLGCCRHLVIEIHHGPGRDRRAVLDELARRGFEEIAGEGKSDEHHHVHLFRNAEL
ncbi:MAG: FkbM family methyltransferase [Pyrinomonadaceae bacterium]